MTTTTHTARRDGPQSVIDFATNSRTTREMYPASLENLVGGFAYSIMNREFLYSVSFRKDDGLIYPGIYQSPISDFSIQKEADRYILTGKCLPNDLDAEAQKRIQNLRPDEIDVFVHNLSPELLDPKIRGDNWDLWITRTKSDIPLAELLVARQKKTEEKAMLMLEQLEQHLPNMSEKRILVLGCGDGREVNVVLEYLKLKDPNSTCSVVAIDQSAFALGSARAHVEAQNPGSNVDFRCLNFSQLNQLSNEKPFDLIIAIGVFDRETLTFEEGTNLASSTRLILKPDGLLATSAYTYELFRRKNYEDLGFSVLQSCVPSRMFTTEHPSLYFSRNSNRMIYPTADLTAEYSYQLWNGEFSLANLGTRTGQI